MDYAADWGALPAGGKKPSVDYGAMKTRAMLTPEETAADAADAQSPSSIAELKSQIAAYSNDPARRKPLEEQLASVQKPSGPDYASDWAALPAQSKVKIEAKPTAAQDTQRRAQAHLLPESQGILENVAAAGSGLKNTIQGGYEGIYNLMSNLKEGKSFTDAMDSASQAVNARTAQTYQPESETGKSIQKTLQSPLNPLNWPGLISRGAGDLTQAAAEGMGASPAVAAGAGILVTGAINAAPLAFIGKKAPKAVAEQPPVAAPSAAIEQVQAAPGNILGERVSTTPPMSLGSGIQVPSTGKVASIVPPTPEMPSAIAGKSAAVPLAAVESPPIAGGVPIPVQMERAAVLQRVGINKAFKSAINGDVMDGAVNTQISRFLDQPAGRAAAEQFSAERSALQNHGQSIIKDTGGTIGLDQDAIHARGQTIAAPFDGLRQWFEKATTGLYKEAETRSGGLPVVSTSPIETILADREFNNSAMAQNQTHLVKAVQNQLDLLKENNPTGLTVTAAEQFRQWLNKNWTNDNKGIIGQVKNAVDDAVMKSAGDDVYGQARAMHKLKVETLENPKGIARLMDVAPNEPLNRATAFEKIPDTLTRLSVDQFKNVIKTLEDMPPELQPQAQAAIGEIKAHMANKLVAEGDKFKTVWNNRGVNKFLSDNGTKMSALFTDPEMIQKISDLRAAGNILETNASYPGAAAQSQLAIKQGLMGRLIAPSMIASGGGVGSFLGGPAGGAAGAFMGRVAGEHLSASAAEAAALRKVNKRLIPLSEVGK